MADGIVAFLLGYRAVALRAGSAREAVIAALTYAAAVAIGAAAIRAMAIPRFLGPALLTLVFYLWDAVISSSPARRRDARWIWPVVLLAVLGVPSELYVGGNRPVRSPITGETIAAVHDADAAQANRVIARV